jgi:hypothetical protein
MVRQYTRQVTSTEKKRFEVDLNDFVADLGKTGGWLAKSKAFQKSNRPGVSHIDITSNG